MVFESIVVDVLNSFLGDYVENLNKSQLKLGIWGGDVVLENLTLKQTALDELNIPVQTVYGHLGKLVLKIPWKNLYGASVEASVDSLFLVVNPTAEVKYDQEIEDKLALAAKQAELARVEEAKRQEAEKELYSKTGKQEIKSRLEKEIASKASKPDFYQYEGDTPRFSLPKVILSLHMEELCVSLTKAQYQDMMKLADSMDRMNKGAPYRNWDWKHMLAHRQLCKDYAEVYQLKLTSKGKISNDLQKLSDNAESKLEAEAKKTQGWFSGWWGGGNRATDDLEEGIDIMKQFQNAMTPDEKEKLFRAIDYQENTAPLHLPVEYVAMESYFKLDRLQVCVNDVGGVLKAAVDNVQLDVKQRPSANALRYDTIIPCPSSTSLWRAYSSWAGSRCASTTSAEC
ncbi:Vacuolar protein sorting-associated protein 13C [Operophtera brumata]|uniref:Vacuolar protein sorting-associated protein 13C n=1 Tax=Operophtera brumata TaxID=104452 RepID=A0A0L7LF70_OPEBR|nr:Vacuolar protein sorting-associated protein 13C [Operophtera brumata]